MTRREVDTGMYAPRSSASAFRWALIGSFLGAGLYREILRRYHGKISALSVEYQWTDMCLLGAAILFFAGPFLIRTIKRQSPQTVYFAAGIVGLALGLLVIYLLAP